MSTKRYILLLTLLAAAASASAQTVVDGSFENTPISGYVYAPTGTDWTYTFPSGLCSGATPWHDAAEDGDQYGFVQSGSGVAGGISGSITGMTAGDTYDLSCILGSRLGYVINPLTILVGSDTIATDVAPADDQSGTGWTRFDVLFVAASSSASLTFEGHDDGGATSTP